MLVDSQRHKVSRVVRREQVTLLLTGVCLALLLTAFSSIYVGYQGVWYRFLLHKTLVNDPLINYRHFVATFDGETESRVRQLGNLDQRMVATDAALAAFTSALRNASHTPVNILYRHFGEYRASGVGRASMGRILQLHLDVVEEATGMVLGLIHDTLSPRPKAAVSTHVTAATVAAYTSVASRTQFLHGSHGYLPPGEREYITAAEATALSVRMAVARSFQRLAAEVDPSSVVNAEGSLVSRLLDPAADIVAKAIGFRQPGNASSVSVTMPTVLESLTGLEAFLASREETAGANTTAALRSLLLLTTGAVLSLLALVATACILVRHARTVGPARRLAAAFEDATARRQLRLRYMPLLQDLRAVKLPAEAAARSVSEVERAYLIAARAVDAVRVAVPQLLMGGPTPAAASARGDGAGEAAGGAVPSGDAAGTWAGEVSGACFPLLSQSPRLELSSVLCRGAVVAEFAVFFASPNGKPAPGGLEREHAVLSSLFRVIVEEVNLSGGVVLGFHEGANVLCAWNVDGSGGGGGSGGVIATEAESARVGEAVVTAIRVSWIVRHRLQHEERVLADPREAQRGETAAGGESLTPPAPRPIAHLCASIASGPMLVANERVVGDRRCPMLAGAALSHLRRMRLVARTASTSTLLDSASQRRIHATWQRHSCKPLVVLRGVGGAAPFTLFCAGEEDGCMTPDQAVLYNAGFVLYQTNMIREAVSEFRQYLSLYPDDSRALWLMNHVLLPKQCGLETGVA